MNYFWTVYIIMLSNTMALAQIEQGSIVSSLGGSLMIQEGKKNTPIDPSVIGQNQYKQNTSNWSITAQGRYFINKHWQAGIYLGYGMSRSRQRFSYVNIVSINSQRLNNFTYKQASQYTSSYKAGPSLGYLSGSKFRASLFCHMVPYVSYYKTKLYYDTNMGQSMELNEGFSYGILIQPAIWYSLSERFILEFTPIAFNFEHPAKKGAASELSFKASLQAISFSINYQLK